MMPALHVWGAMRQGAELGEWLDVATLAAHPDLARAKAAERPYAPPVVRIAAVVIEERETPVHALLLEIAAQVQETRDAGR